MSPLLPIGADAMQLLSGLSGCDQLHKAAHEHKKEAGHKDLLYEEQEPWDCTLIP